MNTPQVRLLAITPNIESLMGQVWDIAKTTTPLDQMRPMLPDQIDDILSSDLPTTEYIQTVWCVEGMPRAFWDQFDRTRLATFWEQSVRILDLRTFASTPGGYWTPQSIENNEDAKVWYGGCMSMIEVTYNKLLKLGIPSEEARGVLPLHLNVRGTCSINLRALKTVIANRVCFISQGSYWLPVVSGMLQELHKYLLPKTMRSLVNLPCAGKEHCPIESNVRVRLTAEDPNPVCPEYLRRFGRPGDRAVTLAKHPNYATVEQGYFQFLDSIQSERSA